MNAQSIVLLVFGLTFLILGFSLSMKDAVTEWGLGHGRGRLWVSWLGKERALKVAKYFFGPLCVFLGSMVLVVSVGAYLPR